MKGNKYRSLLCLQGELPSADYLQNLLITYANISIVAADGGATALLKMGIKPDVVIGDFDSFATDAWVKEHIELINIHDQDKTDHQKAMAYLREHNLLPTIVLGASGGYLDHILHNISVFCEDEGNLIIAPPMHAICLKKGMHVIETGKDKRVSIMPMPKACVTSQYLKWDLDECVLGIGEFCSISNQSMHDVVNLTVLTGCILVLWAN